MYKMKRILLILLAAIYGLGVIAQTDNEMVIEGICYLMEKDGAIVTSYDKNYSGDISIPKSILFKGKALPVVRIGKNAFEWCRTLHSVNLPESISSIDECAFQGCNELHSIFIPNGVVTIGRNAFRGCISLNTIHMPNSLTSIGERAFYSCSNLGEVTLPSSLSYIGVEAFAHCSKLIKVNGWKAEQVKSNKAFYDTPFEQQDYNYYIFQQVYPQIEEWQIKGEFEKTTDYQLRVTKENQKKKIKELTTEATEKYIKQYTEKNKFKSTLESYNADNELYALNSNYGIQYVKVPLSEAPSFKQNFGRATFDVSYAIGGNKPQVANMTVFINGKTYQAEKGGVQLAENDFQIDLPTIDIGLAQNQQSVSPTKPIAIDRSIDQNIPCVNSINKNNFAVIIGNETYTQVAHAPYAQNDAKIFAEYCKKTLGLPIQNVRIYENATFGTMLSAINDIRNIAEAYGGDINMIFYYAGHGIPNETTQDAFLLPVDADGKQTEACYPVSRLYKELGGLGAKNVVVFMDACFSGAQRGDGMLASARGVALKAKAEAPQGNMVVFSAATGDETAYPYKEKGHGLFTYFLLKKLQESNGDCTLGELGEYIQQNVRQQSVVINRKSQTPTIKASANLSENWRNMKLK